MNNLSRKLKAAVATVSTAIMMMPVSTFAKIQDPGTINGTGKGADFSGVAAPIVGLLESLMTPLLAIVGAAGSLYCVVLGVKFAKAGEPQEREKAKNALKNAIIGFVLIFVLILALDIAMPNLVGWVNDNTGTATVVAG